MKLKLLLVLLSLVGWTAMSAQTNVSGNITTNTTWNLAGSPYIVTGNVTVQAGDTLTIENGVEVLFNAGRTLYNYGRIDANGVTFSSNQASKAAGDWNYIYPRTGSYTRIVNSTIEYGRQIYQEAGTMEIDSSTVQFMSEDNIRLLAGATAFVSNSFITGNSKARHGFYLSSGTKTNYASLTLTSTQITDCNAAVAIYKYARMTITSCNLSNNNYPLYYYDFGQVGFAGINVIQNNTNQFVPLAFHNLSDTITLWRTGLPYHATNGSGIRVNAGGKLTIASNVIVKFRRYVQLQVDGVFEAIADPGEKIYLTSDRDDNLGGDSNGDGSTTAPAKMDWRGVRFNDASQDASCVMRRVEVRYAGYGSVGGVSCYNASPTVDSCEFNFNYYGIMMSQHSSPTLTDNLIGSSQMTPIAMSFEANPVFTDNEFSFSDNQYDAIGLLGGTLTQNAHIIKRNVTGTPNVTYMLLSAVTVPDGLSLTIASGIVIKSLTHGIVVKGKIYVNGTNAEKVVFTSVHDDNHGKPNDTNKNGTTTTPAVGNWRGITIHNNGDTTSYIKHSIIKYASTYYNFVDNNRTVWVLGSGLALVKSSPKIEHCEFKDLNYGISCYQDSKPKIENNSMVNIPNTPFALSGSADPSFTGNTFTNVSKNALGLIGGYVTLNGTLRKRTVATFPNITYMLLGNVTIDPGVQLNVDPGVVVKAYGHGITVDGSFRAVGTSSEKIVFTSLRDDNYGSPFDTNGDGNATAPAGNNWTTIHYRNASNDTTSRLEHCIIKFNRDGVTFTSASPTVKDVVVDNASGYGVKIEETSIPPFTNLDIRNCGSDPIAMSLLADPTFTGTTFTANGSKGIRILEGTLSSDATLKQRNVAGITNIAYVVDDINVASNAKLTINPGVVIKFRGSYFMGIVVNGGLKANGTATQKVVFTSIKDDSVGGDTNNDGNQSSPAVGNWHYIEFKPSSMDAFNSLKNCEVRYVSGSYYTSVGAISASDSYVDVDSTVIQLATWGIGSFGSANPSIKNTSFQNIQTPVLMSMFSTPTFSGNTANNIERMGIQVKAETYSQNGTFPFRNFAGIDSISYILSGSYVINAGTTIDIPAGMTFKRINNSPMDVKGRLNVNGTASQKVVFTDYRDDMYGNPKDLNQDGTNTSPVKNGSQCIIYRDESEDSSKVEHALFRYIDTPILLQSASPTITNCSFEESNYGVGMTGVCAPHITNNTFTNAGFPFYFSLVSYPATTTGNVIAGKTYRALRINNETLNQDITLPKRAFAGLPNIPYVFQSYTIGTSATLTIKPGVISKFLNGGTIRVQKGLIAEGGSTVDSTIVFTTFSDDNYGGDSNADSTASHPKTNYWYGIKFENTAIDNLSRIKHAILANSPNWSSNGAITTVNASPTITHSTFLNNSTAVYATGASNPLINYCDFIGNTVFGVNNKDKSFIIDARNCWWGDNSGPEHSGNPGGTGDEVSDAVNYTPWITTGSQNPILGDVSLNGQVQPYDASLVLQDVVGSITLTSTQENVADVTGNGAVSSLDASLILQYTIGSIQTFPAATKSGPLATAGDKYSAQLSMEDVEFTGVGEALMPVYIDNAYNFLAGELRLQFDNTSLKVTRVELGDDFIGSQLVYRMDEQTGELVIAMASAEELPKEGHWLNLVFESTGVDPQSNEVEVSASQFVVNENDYSANVTAGRVIFSTPTGYATAGTSLKIYPNPMQNAGQVMLNVAGTKEVALNLYDMRGRNVATLINGTVNGHQNVAIDSEALGLEKGVYLLHLNVEGAVSTFQLQVR